MPRIIQGSFKRLIIVLVLIGIGGVDGHAQVVVESGSLQSKVEMAISNMPDDTGNNFTTPSNSELNIWKNALRLLLDSSYVDCCLTLDSLRYQLVEFTDTTFADPRIYYLLEAEDSNYWGTYVYYPRYCRNTIIQSPHPKYDFNTGKQGIYVFLETESAFFFMSGTHRCNHSGFSSCDGSTSVCSGSSENFRISDLAHNTQNVFQASTEFALFNIPNPYFVQLHGFGKQSTDPFVILSNGTSITPTLDKLLQFQQELFIQDTSLTFKTAHIDTSWTRLRGFTNTQGRLVNSSPDPCDDSPNSTSGRFFHVEQEKLKLRNDATGWDKISTAINNTFTCNTISIVEDDASLKFSAYPNPTSNTIHIKGRNISSSDVLIFTIHGASIEKEANVSAISNSEIAIDMSNLTRGLYIVLVDGNAIKVVKE